MGGEGRAPTDASQGSITSNAQRRLRADEFLDRTVRPDAIEARRDACRICRCRERNPEHERRAERGLVERLAERAAWHAIEAYGTEPAKKGHGNGGVNIAAVRYLNRLSDLLFVLARYANVKHGGDVKWVPAANRREAPLTRKEDKARRLE